uniref:Uncharacterized protein n=1 Tax=Glossina palpalis gambiensis TaxID=67801 RepID=A0A1B0BR46_9MUSC
MIQDPKDGQQIVRIISSRNNNVHEVETADTENENFLEKNFGVKRSDFILVEPIEEGDKPNKSGNSSRLAFGRNALRGTITNGRYASNYVKETCDENAEEFKEKFSGPCHLSPNRNRSSLLVAFQDESTSLEDDS